MRLARLLRSLDPIAWPAWFAWLAVGVLLLGPYALIFLDLPAPVELILPTWGLVWWRSDGRRYRDIATWVVPLGVFAWVGFQVEPGAFRIAIEGFVVVILVAMLLSDTVKERWLALVAPGVYREMRTKDRFIRYDLATLYRRFLLAYERLYRTTDIGRFRRDLAKVAAKTRALKAPDAEWEGVRRALVHVLEWYADRDGASDEEWDDVHRRRDAFEDALREVSAQRTFVIGGQGS